MPDDTRNHHPELASLLGSGRFSRREMLATSLAAGFALAVQPVGAATIRTDDEGLTAGEVRIPVTNGEIPAYRALPARGEAFPVVLVVQEIFGVHEHIRDLCRRFAKQGYLAVAPELYARQGDVSQLSEIREILKVVAQVPYAQVMGDLDATAAWAGKTGKGDLARLGITGFCWGGRSTWLYAAHRKDLRAGVAWYGRLTGERTALQPKFPIDVAGSLNAPVLGLYGGRDDGIPLDHVEQMRAALEAATSPSRIVVFPDAPHAFLADYRPTYRAEVAADAWAQCLAWFRGHGVG